MLKVTVVDYSAGSLRNISMALGAAGAEVHITDNAEDILAAEKLVLPGVGDFSEAMERLKSKKLDFALRKYAELQKPFLGISLGMQLLFQFSEEGDSPGLGILRGRIIHIPQVGDIKIPQVGWNNVFHLKNSALFDGIADNSYFYFSHSYYLETDSDEIVCASVTHGVDMCAAVESQNILAVQFHPERSGGLGIRLLQNFVEI